MKKSHEHLEHRAYIAAAATAAACGTGSQAGSSTAGRHGATWRDARPRRFGTRCVGKRVSKPKKALGRRTEQVLRRFRTRLGRRKQKYT